jgi:hypothetical protein
MEIAFKYVIVFKDSEAMKSHPLLGYIGHSPKC